MDKENNMKLEVIEEDCIKCGVCYEEAPEAFEDRGDGVAAVKESWTQADERRVKWACEMCPTDCIESTGLSTRVKRSDTSPSSVDSALSDGG
ncbi:MAG: ferredoxin, partial [Halobacteria archaeon]|nr:ferredoxin [Halobacteria archaeon]